MKKDALRLLIVTAILLAVYNLMAFAIPFAHTAAFWISYGFSYAALIVLVASVYIAFVKNPDAKSRFYGFPIARLGVIYAVAQLVVSLVVMAVAKYIPWWVATIVYAIGLGAVLIGLVSAEAVVSEIKVQDVKVKEKVSMMRSLQSKVNHLAAQSDNQQIKELAEEFRYSDPVSNEAIYDAEADLAAAVDQLQAAFVDGDEEAVEKLCRKANALLAERNRLCKLNKNA